MKLINIGEGLTSTKIKVNDHLYGCICNYYVAQSTANIWNGDVVVSNDKALISQSEDGSAKLVCVIDGSLKDEEIYKLD